MWLSSADVFFEYQCRGCPRRPDRSPTLSEWYGPEPLYLRPPSCRWCPRSLATKGSFQIRRCTVQYKLTANDGGKLLPTAHGVILFGHHPVSSQLFLQLLGQPRLLLLGSDRGHRRPLLGVLRDVVAPGHALGRHGPAAQGPDKALGRGRGSLWTIDGGQDGGWP